MFLILLFYFIFLVSWINTYLCNVFTPMLCHEVEGWKRTYKYWRILRLWF